MFRKKAWLLVLSVLIVGAAAYLAKPLLKTDSILPKEQQMAGDKVANPYPPAKLFALGSSAKIGSRDSSWESKLLQSFPNLEITGLNSELAENKALVEKLGIKSFPVYFFDQSLNKNKDLFKAFTQKGLVRYTIAGYHILSYSGAKELIAQTPTPNELTIFVMSQCPYGVQAENAILLALKHKKLPESFKLKLRFIVRPKIDPEWSRMHGLKTVLAIINFFRKPGPKWSSMHGQAELDENIRQIIIQKYFPEKLLGYLKLRNADYGSDKWEEAAKKAGLDTAALKNRLPEGEALLEREYNETSALNISASPTFLWENRYLLTSGSEIKKFLGSDPFATPDGKPAAPASCQ